MREHMQPRAHAEPFRYRPNELQIGERVALALQKQHRQLHAGKMPRALNRRALRGVKGEAQESKTAYTGERSGSLRLLCHAPAE